MSKLTDEQLLLRELHIIRAVNRINYRRNKAKRDRAIRLRDKQLNDDFNAQMHSVRASECRQYRYLRYRSKTY